MNVLGFPLSCVTLVSSIVFKRDLVESRVMISHRPRITLVLLCIIKIRVVKNHCEKMKQAGKRKQNKKLRKNKNKSPILPQYLYSP